jgi:hypothetical protein
MGSAASVIFALLRERRRRVVVTLVAIIVLMLMQHIPAPGVPREMLEALGLGNPASLAMTSYQSWATAAVLAQIGLLIYLTAIRAKTSVESEANPFAGWVVLLALLISLVHGYYAGRVFHNAYQTPGAMNQAYGVVTFALSVTAGAAIAIAMARWIEREGIGWGFWVVQGLLAIEGLSAWLLILRGYFAQRTTDARSLIPEIVLWVVIALLAVVIVKVRERSGLRNGGNLLWPWLISPYLTSVLVSVLILVTGDGGRTWILNHGTGFGHVAGGIVFAGLLFMCLRDDATSKAKLATVIACSAIYVLPIVMFHLGLRVIDWGGFLFVLLALASAAIESAAKDRSRIAGLKRAIRS